MFEKDLGIIRAEIPQNGFRVDFLSSQKCSRSALVVGGFFRGQRLD
jgi:hypothetical protein